MIIDPLLNLYFTSPAEAVFSLFRESVVAPFELSIGQPLAETGQRTNELDDLYLNTFYLNEDLIINPMQNSNLERELKTDPNLAEVRDAIRDDCAQSRRDGFIIPYLATLFYGQQQNSQTPIKLIARITTYVLCRQNLLLHAQSFRILKDVVLTDLQELINVWTAESKQKLTGGVVVDILTRYLKDNRGRVLEEVYVQPEVNGLATSPVAAPQIPLPIIEPPSSMISPQDPSIFMAQQLSPGGTTAYDAFISVPTDVLRVMALNMTLDALSSTCRTSQRFNQAICNNNDFWALRVEQDFGRRHDATNTVMQRKPETWSWKRYYAELSGNLPPNQILDFADFKNNPELVDEINNLPRDDYEPRVNEMRREAGLGVIDFERPDFQGFRRPMRDQNVRRRLFVQPIGARGVMGPVVENPEARRNFIDQPARGGGFPNRDRAGFNMDFDGDDVNVQVPEPRRDGQARDIDNMLRGLPEHLRVNLGPNNQRNLQDLLAPLPANPADIRRLFASQEDYQDFFERYNPQPDIRQRARPLRAGVPIPDHLRIAFGMYRDLVLRIRAGGPGPGTEALRDRIFGELTERAALIGSSPALILDRQLGQFANRPDLPRWPRRGDEILRQQFQEYVGQHPVQHGNLNELFGDGQGRPNNIGNILEGLPQRFNVDAREIRPVAGPFNLVERQGRDMQRGVVAQVPDPAAGRLFASARDFLDFQRRYEPAAEFRRNGIPIRAGDAMPVHLNAAFDQYRNLLMLIRIGRPIEELRREIFDALLERAALIGADPEDVLHQQILGIEQMRPDADVWPQNSRQILMRQVADYMAERQQRAPAVGVRAGANMQPPPELINLHRLYGNVIQFMDFPPNDVFYRTINQLLLSLDARRGRQTRLEQFNRDIRNFNRYPEFRLGPAIEARLRALLGVAFQNEVLNEDGPPPLRNVNDQPPQDLLDVHRLYANLIANFDQPQEVQQPVIEAFLRSLDLRRAQAQFQSRRDQFIDDMRNFDQYPQLVDGLTRAQTARIERWLRRLEEADRQVPLNIRQAQGRFFRNAQREADQIDVPGELLQRRQDVAPIIIPPNIPILARRPALSQQQIRYLTDQYTRLVRAIQANDEIRIRNEIEALRREIEPRAIANELSPLAQVYADLEDITLGTVGVLFWPLGSQELIQQRFRQIYEPPQQ